MNDFLSYSKGSTTTFSYTAFTKTVRLKIGIKMSLSAKTPIQKFKHVHGIRIAVSMALMKKEHIIFRGSNDFTPQTENFPYYGQWK
mmetsp:Transcript_23001/g.36949  ORF Transcript_23001/g.36949 Transcript_23001/m.36949 type:complete len:86 (+) Transcript_23001:1923-2180(+)